MVNFDSHHCVLSIPFLSLQPIPDNVFIVAACNPHRGNPHHGNSLLSHGGKEIWVRGTYYVRQLHPTLRFLTWDYGSMDKDQEREYINAKMEMLSKEKQTTEVGTCSVMVSGKAFEMQNLLISCVDTNHSKIIWRKTSPAIQAQTVTSAAQTQQ